MMPSRFWLAKMVSRSLFQPWSNRCMSLIFSIHSGVGWCGACVPPGHVVDEERLVGRDRLDPLHVLDRLVRHGRGQVPARLALEGVDGGRVAVEVRLPLAGVAAHEAVEVLEAHAVRPLIERPGLRRQIGRRVVVLAEPRGRVPVLLQDRADRAVLLPDDRVVARESGPDFTDHAVAGHVVVAPGDQGRARRRAQRRRVEVRVAQPALRDAIEGGCRDDAAERARRAEAAVVRHDRAARWAHPSAARRVAPTSAFDSEAFSLITPPNFGSGGGSSRPLMLAVARGEPGSVGFLRDAPRGIGQEGGTRNPHGDDQLDCLHARSSVSM